MNRFNEAQTALLHDWLSAQAFFDDVLHGGYYLDLKEMQDDLPQVIEKILNGKSPFERD